VAKWWALAAAAVLAVTVAAVSPLDGGRHAHGVVVAQEYPIGATLLIVRYTAGTQTHTGTIPVGTDSNVAVGTPIDVVYDPRHPLSAAADHNGRS
jgi:hypothetical protein